MSPAYFITAWPGRSWPHQDRSKASSRCSEKPHPLVHHLHRDFNQQGPHLNCRFQVPLSLQRRHKANQRSASGRHESAGLDVQVRGNSSCGIQRGAISKWPVKTPLSERAPNLQLIVWLLGGSAEKCGARTVLAPTQHNRSSRRHRGAPRWAARPKSALVVSKTHKED
jgi:hypothetical protein